MNEKEKKIINQFKSQLLKNVSVVDFRLFGSRAKGISREFSDYDFFIVVEDNSPEVIKRIRDIAWEVAFEHNTFINTVILSYPEIEGRMKHSTIYQMVQKEGIPL